MITTSLFAGFFLACNAQHKRLTVGDAVPLFSLKDQQDSLFNIADYIGKKILVVYFYPKDESSVCTKEACSFRDGYADFTRAGAMVIGINSGSVESHRHFQANHQLPFTLLSDPGNRVLKLFGVKSKFMISGRETFVIDKTGKIRFTYDSFMDGPAHEAEALKFIKTLPA
ncbi:MAG: peroxiredoxin [Bacteroidota bacterium]|nr:peroxiredoxin [Bacteroidota bacterium]